MYRYRDFTTGHTVNVADRISDGQGQLFVFLGGCPDDPNWILVFNRGSLGDALNRGDDDWMIRRHSLDFGMTPERDTPGSEAHVWLTDDEVNVAISDGRTVSVNAQGIVTVWGPDRMHGTKFSVPPGTQWGRTLTVPLTPVGENQTPANEDGQGVFITCANAQCVATHHGEYPWSSLTDVRALARKHHWGSVNGNDFCPDHGGKVINHHFPDGS